MRRATKFWAADFSPGSEGINPERLADINATSQDFRSSAEGFRKADGRPEAVVAFTDTINFVLQERLYGAHLWIRHQARSIEVLTKRLDVLEARPSISYQQLWSADRRYSAGDAVTFDGSLFIAQQNTTDKPETSAAWRLAVKRGRDGKDARSR
jgi:hypothetical protein